MGKYSKLHDKVYREIVKEFPEFRIRENIRPEWLLSSNLTRLEIDIFIEDINTAIEIQGAQHYEYIPYFHKTYQDFKDQQERDREKRDLCRGKGISLVEIACDFDLYGFISELKKTYKYSELAEHFEALNSQDLFDRYYKPKSRKSILRSEKYRQARMVRKLIARRKKLRGTKTPKKPALLIGTKRQRHYARYILFIEQVDFYAWHVWGGENDHLVIQGSSLVCDCRANKICCHIIKVMMSNGITL